MCRFAFDERNDGGHTVFTSNPATFTEPDKDSVLGYCILVTESVHDLKIGSMKFFGNAPTDATSCTNQYFTCVCHAGPSPPPPSPSPPTPDYPYHFLDPGVNTCDHGEHVEFADCSAAVDYLLVALGHTQTRGIQSDGGTTNCAQGWGRVPAGCSFQSNPDGSGDWTAHFTPIANGDNGCDTSNYRTVCATFHPTPPPPSPPPASPPCDRVAMFRENEAQSGRNDVRLYNDSANSNYGVDLFWDGTPTLTEGLISREYCLQKCCEDPQCVGIDYWKTVSYTHLTLPTN